MKISLRYWNLFAAAFAASALLIAGCGDTDVVVDDADERPSLADVDYDAETPDRDSSAIPADYPLDECVISGENLRSMGEPYAHEVEGGVVMLCCPPCKDDVDADPERYLAQIEQARDGE